MLTTPVVRCLYHQVPGAEIHFLTKKAFAPVLQHNPYIHRLHLLDGDLNAAVKPLKQENFDGVIDLHHNLRSLRVKKILGAPSRSFAKLNIEKWLLTGLKINVLPSVHIVDRYLDTVRHLGVENDGKGLDYFLNPAGASMPELLPAAVQEGFIGLVAGAALATKRLPVEQLQNLCSRLSYPVVILGGPEDREAGEKIAAIRPELVVNACGKLNLNQSAALVKRSRLIISHDTGLMHIAAAFQKPIISIWGNTVPAFGMDPYYGRENAAVPAFRFEVQGLKCRPCSKIGYDRCPKGHFNCMTRQPLDQIADAANRLFEQTAYPLS